MKKICIILIFSFCILQGKMQPITVFLHGIVANASQAQKYIGKTIITPCITPEFPDTQEVNGYSLNSMLWHIAQFWKKPLNREQCYLGQTEDVLSIIDTIPADDPIILYGVSRGGTAALRFLAQYNPCNVQAIIIESAPHDVAHKSYELKQAWGLSTDHKAIMQTLFPAYNPQEPSILECISLIKNKDLPIMIVHAQTDARVSYSQSLELYYAFYSYGFTNVFLVPLPQGNHTFIIDSNTQEAMSYTTAVHSFYKLFGLPYSTEHAVLSTEQLQQLYQFHTSAIEQYLTQDKEQLTSLYNQQVWYNRMLLGSTITALGLYFAYIYYTNNP